MIVVWMLFGFVTSYLVTLFRFDSDNDRNETLLMGAASATIAYYYIESLPLIFHLAVLALTVCELGIIMGVRKRLLTT